MGKVVIISAPSGTGKSTIVSAVMGRHPEFRLRFSISATSRPPRGAEQHGVEYYFFSPEEFRSRIASGDFLEWEEVYTDKYYGTLLGEVERVLKQGDNLIFDVDYVGGINLKERFGSQALSIFVEPPSLEELERRLRGRGTDSEELIAERLEKARLELSAADRFDLVVVNDDLETCIGRVTEAIAKHLQD